MSTPDNDSPTRAYFINTDSIDPLWGSEGAETGRPFDMIGTTAAPPHYAGEREAIDIIRDELGDDEAFARWCFGTALKYALRWGSKPGGSVDEDRDKMIFYTKMALHIEAPNEAPDPRSNRPGFKPYVRSTGRLAPEVYDRVRCALMEAVVDALVWQANRGSNGIPK